MLVATLSCVCLVYLASNMSMLNSCIQTPSASVVPRASSCPIDSCGGSDDPSVSNHWKAYSMEELMPILQPWTMVSVPHQKLAVDAMLKLNRDKVPGDVVECGVWKGGMTMGMIFANVRDNSDRHFWLFDTFEGLPQPTEKDDKRAHSTWAQVQEGDPHVNDSGNHRVEEGKWNYGPLGIVKNNVFYTHYPRDKIHFIQGKVEDSLPITKLPEKIAMLRLDTDFYESTKIELEYLWDRLVPGGILIIDDFCAWGGARSAVTEFFKAKLGLDAVKISQQGPCMHYWKK
jgi:O-methyltransferase